MMDLHRNDEAVSAAIATVLLFGGVVSIISLMMVTMIPVIEELEGSVERHDMSAQMTQFNHRTRHSEQQRRCCYPRVCSVDGALSWDMIRAVCGIHPHGKRAIPLEYVMFLILMTCSRCVTLNRLPLRRAFRSSTWSDRPYHYRTILGRKCDLTTKPGLTFLLDQ